MRLQFEVNVRCLAELGENRERTSGPPVAEEGLLRHICKVLTAYY